jgi:hypothetical protein
LDANIQMAVERFLFLFVYGLEYEEREPGPVDDYLNGGLKPPSPGDDPVFFRFAAQTGV